MFRRPSTRIALLALAGSLGCLPVCGPDLRALDHHAALQVPFTPKRDFDVGASVGLQVVF